MTPAHANAAAAAAIAQTHRHAPQGATRSAARRQHLGTGTAGHSTDGGVGCRVAAARAWAANQPRVCLLASAPPPAAAAASPPLSAATSSSPSSPPSARQHCGGLVAGRGVVASRTAARPLWQALLAVAWRARLGAGPPARYGCGGTAAAACAGAGEALVHAASTHAGGYATRSSSGSMLAHMRPLVWWCGTYSQQRRWYSSNSSSSSSNSIGNGHDSRSSRSSRSNGGQVIKPRALDNLVGYRVRRAVVDVRASIDSSASGSGSIDSSAAAALPLQSATLDQELIRGAGVRFSDAAALKLRRRACISWQPGKPTRVLLVKKPQHEPATHMLRAIADYLRGRGLAVCVERAVRDRGGFADLEAFDAQQDNEPVDLCITLGGDGTVLHLASLFARDEPLPPVLCFAMGTLGFLTPFDCRDYRSCIDRCLDARAETPVYCTLRTRQRCEVVQDGGVVPQRVHHVLNECVIDRGSFPGIVPLEIYVDGSYLTKAELDGLIIATPSGSTAYSMSAGGAMVAPSVPCTLLTPTAPLSLSFRPLIIPESSDILVRLPVYARSHARASFDGKQTMRIHRGSAIHFTTSLCPLPLINLGNYDSDWYSGITQKLKWNQQIRAPPGTTPPAPSAAACLSSSKPGGSNNTVSDVIL